MTREEAIEELKYIKDSFVSCTLSYDALDTAIRSLEAWDKVLKELHEEWTDSNTFRIIHKHLKEVEDEQIHRC